MNKWYIDEVGPVDGRGYSIRLDENDMSDGDEEVALAHSETNARLIAALPDLLAALEALMDAASNQLPQGSDHDGLTNCDLLASARQAIDKATDGESQTDWEERYKRWKQNQTQGGA